MTRTLWRRWLGEPLLQFTLIGIALFCVDRWLGDSPTGASYPRRIVVTASQQAALREAFRNERGHDPTTDELRARLDFWIEEQVLYREALALGLDHKDAIVRRQLAQKMRFLLSDAVLPSEPTPAQLQQWLDQHAERFGRPGTVSFQQVFLSRGRHGNDLSAVAEKIAGQLKKYPDRYLGLGDPFLTGQVVSDASGVRLRGEFGSEFAAALEKLPFGQWSGPIASGFGLHLVRVISRKPFQAATLTDVAERVRADYRTAERERMNQEALARLRAQYQIEFEAPLDGDGKG